MVSEDTAIAGAGRHIMIRTGDELTQVNFRLQVLMQIICTTNITIS